MFRRLCPPQLLEEIEGDLHQRFVRDVGRLGVSRAKRKLVWNVIRFFRPGILLRNKFSTGSGSQYMIGNYYKVSMRQIQKNKAFTLINVLGLGLAFCSSLLIFQYVAYEMSFDKNFKDKARIFRLQEDRFKNGVVENQWAAAVGLVGPSVKEDFYEVEEYVQVFPYDLSAPDPVVSYEDRFFKEEEAFFATDRFFKIFSVKLLRGVDSTVLKRPFTAAISQSMTRKYFGDVDPVGKQLSLDKAQQFEVTAVFEDFPRNTHFHPDLLLSMETIFKGYGNTLTWGNGGFHTYILLREGTDPSIFESKLPEFILRRAGEQLKIWDEGIVLNLQRIDQIHLDSHYIWEYDENGDRARTYFMAVIGVFIVLIALINYTNLSIAKSIERAKEVGVRKVVGGLRRQLIQQFIFESMVIHALAISLGLLMLVGSSFLATGWLNISIPLNFLFSYAFWLVLGIIFLFSICLSAFYPALHFSSYSIVAVLKGGPGRIGGGTNFFRTLTVSQIAISVILMILSWCVYEQINFMQGMDNGFAKDQILVLRAPNQWDSLYDAALNAFKKDMLAKNGVEYVVATSDVPGKTPTLRAGGVRRIMDSKENAFDCTPPLVDYNYVEMLKLKLLAGRSFSETMMDDYSKVLVNEEALAKLRIKEPREALGVRITFWRDTFEIIGVLKNYHHESLRKEILPMVFRFSPYHRGYISVKTGSMDIAQAVREAEQVWKQYFPGFPFEFFFLDENFNKQYAGDQQFKNIVTVFALIAIFIACIGLFGLSMLSTARRVKEIGIRKILGATSSAIMILLNKDFVILMILSSAIAVPTAWMIVDWWLEGFVSRIEMSLWFFVLPVTMAMMASFVAVSFRTIRAANENPVKSLKYE